MTEDKEKKEFTLPKGLQPTKFIKNLEFGDDDGLDDVFDAGDREAEERGLTLFHRDS